MESARPVRRARGRFALNTASTLACPAASRRLCALAALALACPAAAKQTSIPGGNGCPSNDLTICSGHGACLAPHVSSTAPYVCDCYDGYGGGDCSVRLCPSARAWADYPTKHGAHASGTECAGMGYCDRNTGQCACRAGFGGSACELLLCPVGLGDFGTPAVCSGHGDCRTMREAAERVEPHDRYDGASTYTAWDADMVRGCVCAPGFTGYDCSERTCARGDDPLTAGGLNELQLLDCQCGSAGCGAETAFTLSYKGLATASLPHDSTPELVEAALEALSVVDDVRVNFFGGAESVCSTAGVVTRVTFMSQFGTNLKPLVAAAPAAGLVAANGEGLAVLSVATGGLASGLDAAQASVACTKEDAECSNRGQCHPETGRCTCFGKFANSDGNGGPGLINDCGCVKRRVPVPVPVLPLPLPPSTPPPLLLLLLHFARRSPAATTPTPTTQLTPRPPSPVGTSRPPGWPPSRARPRARGG